MVMIETFWLGFWFTMGGLSGILVFSIIFCLVCLALGAIIVVAAS